MNNPILVGLTGYAGTGKDTVRAILEAEGATGFAFADPMRGMLRELLTSTGIDDAWMDQRELKEQVIPALGVSYRQMMQRLGTEWGRGLANDMWLRLADAYMAGQQKLGEVAFVVSDVRFENEAQWVRNHGGVIWRVHRVQATPVQGHVSETELDNIKPDVTIHNSTTLDDLRARVLGALEAWA